jgi:23S rRNA pseudouridine2605 synthase
MLRETLCCRAQLRLSKGMDKADKDKADRDQPAAGPERNAKVVARAGRCARRDAERWIGEGRVSVKGQKLTSPAVKVGDSDLVEVDGKPLPQKERQRLWRYHKPAGLVVSHKDEKNRRSVFDELRDRLPRVVSIGRLDLNTEGLLLVTNDGELARHIELPATGWVRRYRVRAHGKVEPETLVALKDGISIDGVHYGAITATLDKIQGGNCWLTFALREGKNREIKRVCEHLGLKVNRLIRVSFGPFQLGDLKTGAIEEVPPNVLRDQIGRSKPSTAGKKARKPHADRWRKA